MLRCDETYDSLPFFCKHCHEEVKVQVKQSKRGVNAITCTVCNQTMEPINLNNVDPDDYYEGFYLVTFH